MEDKEAEEQSLELDRIQQLLKSKSDTLSRRKEFEKAKKELEDQIRNVDIQFGVVQAPPISNLSPEQIELEKLRKEVEYLKSIKSPDMRQQFITATPEWFGELDYNHPGLEHFAKSVHKKYKDIDLGSSFNYSTPFSKNNELGEAKLL